MNVKYTADVVQQAVSTSTSWASLALALDKSSRGGALSHLKKVCIKFNIDYSHFRGQSWSKGKELNLRKKPIEYYLRYGSSIHSAHLRKKLIKDNIFKPLCSLCEQETWLDEPIPLELHHKDHDHKNNQLDNLELLCPNCHALKTIHYSQLGGMHTRKS